GALRGGGPARSRRRGAGRRLRRGRPHGWSPSRQLIRWLSRPSTTSPRCRSGRSSISTTLRRVSHGAIPRAIDIRSRSPTPERSGPQRVRDLFGTEAERLLRSRFAVINVWKPIRGPVEQAPLAVCDARTIGPDDFVPTDLRYRDRSGEVYSLRFSPTHAWFYFPRMQADEAMLLKCFDSDRSCARFTAHSAFDDPGSRADARARESIEVRTLAFFGEA